MKTLRVLVPLDGSPLSESVLPLALGLAPAELLLLEAVDSSLVGGESEDVRSRAIGGGYLAAVAERIRASGRTGVEALVREGRPAATILEVAAERAVGLVALATHGRSGFDRLVLGSIAEKVIRASPVPVLAVRTSEPPAPSVPARPLFGSVLVPHDGSDLASRAIEALAILGGAGRARLTLLGVVEAYDGAPPSRNPRDRENVAERFLRLRADDLRETLERVARRARDLGFEVSADVEIGRPAATILDWAKALSASLIAMSTHGRSGISRWTLGSVTEQVLRATTVPLLICR